MKDNEKYYVIRSTEDGIGIQEYKNKEDMLSEIDEDYGIDIDKYHTTFSSNIGMWEKSHLIIKGKIVAPKVKEIIKTVEIE